VVYELMSCGRVMLHIYQYLADCVMYTLVWVLSGFVIATAHSGEKARNVKHHWPRCFAAYGCSKNNEN